MTTKGTILKRLRSRPKHERQILAAIIYLAASAIVLALWVNSFRAVIAPAQIAFENTPAPALERGEAPPPQLAQLTTPFETLREGIKNIAAGFQNTGREDASPTATDKTPIAAPAAPLTEAFTRSTSATALGPAANLSNPSAKHSPSLGEVLGQIRGEPDSSRTAVLPAARAEQTEFSASGGFGQELIRLIGDGLASLRHAASTLYASLTNS